MRIIIISALLTLTANAFGDDIILPVITCNVSTYRHVIIEDSILFKGLTKEQFHSIVCREISESERITIKTVREYSNE